MFDYNQIVQQRQRQEAIAKRANAPEPEGWTQSAPSIFDLLFAAMKLSKQSTKQGVQATFNPLTWAWLKSFL